MTLVNAMFLKSNNELLFLKPWSNCTSKRHSYTLVFHRAQWIRGKVIGA